MIVLIFSGTISFIGIQAYDEYRAVKNRDQKINITGLTDFELQPIEKQDMDYEDAVSYFKSARNSKKILASQDGIGVTQDSKIYGSIADFEPDTSSFRLI